MANMVKEGIGQFLEEEEKTGAGAGDGGGGGGALDTLLRRRWLSGFCFDRLRSTVEAGHATGATALAEGRRVAEAVGVSTKEIEAMGSAGEALYACFEHLCERRIEQPTFVTECVLRTACGRRGIAGRGRVW